MVNREKEQVRIEGERVYLRGLTEKDATEEYCSWLNDPAVNAYLDTKQATIESLREYIREKTNAQDCLFLGIFDQGTDRHIGNIKLEPVDLKEKKATLGVLIGDKEYWGKGIGTETVRLLVNYAFNTLDLGKLDLGVRPGNKAAKKVYENCGFVVEDTKEDLVTMYNTRVSFLVVGCGSIGKRHIRNLINLGQTSIIVCDLDEENLKQAKELGARATKNFKSGLEGADAVLVCTPNHLHTKFAKEALESGKHVFIEKPIADKLDGLEELKALSEKKKLVLQVGCNLRFHPLLAKAKKALDESEIGEIYASRIEYGSYLPGWRPGQDYSKNYAAKKETGGGIILDDIHEIDYATWLLGEMKNVFCSAGKISDLDIETEDNAELLLRTKKGATVNIHMDYLQRDATRRFKFIGSEGMIEGDLRENVFRIFKDDKWDEQKEEFDDNQTYVDEMKEFIKCVKTGGKPLVGYVEGVYALKIALAAKESAAADQVVMLEEEK